MHRAIRRALAPAAAAALALGALTACAEDGPAEFDSAPAQHEGEERAADETTQQQDEGQHPQDEGADDEPAGGQAGAEGEDRKSTRLNSSHVAISYAVFCLKKKK